jgi:hypothetical protein
MKPLLSRVLPPRAIRWTTRTSSAMSANGRIQLSTIRTGSEAAGSPRVARMTAHASAVSRSPWPRLASAEAADAGSTVRSTRTSFPSRV